MGGGGRAYFKSHIFNVIHNNFSYVTIITITKTEQENVFFYHHFTNATSFVP